MMSERLLHQNSEKDYLILYKTLFEVIIGAQYIIIT